MVADVTLAQLRAFAEATRLGSFTAAAATLRMSQASVSELVRRLEEEFGVQLFNRGRRRLVLTSAGQELLAHAQRALTAVEDAQRSLESVRALSGGRATFGVPRVADYYLLAGLIEEFCTMHPAVRMRLVGMNSADVAAAVTDGTLEAGIVILPVDTEGLVVTPWARDEVVYVSADPAHTATPRTIQDLATARLILSDANVGWRDPARRQLADRAAQAGVRLDPWIEVEHAETALRLASRGLGDTLVSRGVLAAIARSTDLCRAPLDPPLHDTIALIYRESVPLSSAAREFARLAHRALQRFEGSTLSPARGKSRPARQM